jgi:hypothetical protein
MSGSFKMAGFSGFGNSPMKDKDAPYSTVKDASNSLTKTGQGKDVTSKYKKTGNKKTRDHIAAGGKVMLMPNGSLALKSTTT